MYLYGCFMLSIYVLSFHVSGVVKYCMDYQAQDKYIIINISNEIMCRHSRYSQT